MKKQKTIQLLKNCRGSIALISVLVISAVVLMLALTMSEVNISTSYQYLNNTSNKISYYTAEACLEEAVIRLEEDPTFSNGSIIIDPDTSCTIAVSGSSISITVTFLAYIQKYVGTISITTAGQANNVELLNWSEI